jgi:hypothetical protein
MPKSVEAYSWRVKSCRLDVLVTRCRNNVVVTATNRAALRCAEAARSVRMRLVETKGRGDSIFEQVIEFD